MLSRFRRQVRGLAGRIRQLSWGLSVCRQPSARAEIHSQPSRADGVLPDGVLLGSGGPPRAVSSGGEPDGNSFGLPVLVLLLNDT